MNDSIPSEIRAYYDARAQEYDEIYSGKGPAIPDQDAYKTDAAKISKLVSPFGKGSLIDIGCGTGFWLPHYAPNCSRITLIDQSEKMLSKCRTKIDKLRLTNKCNLIRGDFFDVAFGDYSFDSALVGFFISHLSFEREQTFFKKLGNILKPDAQLMLIDSAWSRKRQQHRKKEGIQERVLNNGRIFNLYKRYFDKADIEAIFNRYQFKLLSLYMGDVFLAAQGTNSK
jgi:ubiquinone/menaquinone biosynthesis C-methylase UbiE